MTQVPTQRPRPARLVLSAAHGEQIRTAAETMAVGVLVAVFSLPLVTAGAAWCAAAEIFAAWHEKREPPLLRTFLRTLRRDLAAGVVVAVAFLGPLVAAWFEVHVVVRTRMPGYPVEAGALALLGAGAAAFVLLTVACRAAGAAAGQARDGSLPPPLAWDGAVRRAAQLARAVPSSLVLVVTGGAFCAVLVALIPAFAAFMAGPLAFAVSAVVTRGARRDSERDGRRRGV